MLIVSLALFFGLVSSDLAQFRAHIPNLSDDIRAYVLWAKNFRFAFERMNDQELLDVVSSCSCARCPEEDKDLGRVTLLSQISPSFVANARRIIRLLKISENLSPEVRAAFAAYLNDEIRLRSEWIRRFHNFADQFPDRVETVEGVVEFLAHPGNVPRGGYLGPVVYEGRTSIGKPVVVGEYINRRLLESLLEFYAGRASEAQYRTIIFRYGIFYHGSITYHHHRLGEKPWLVISTTSILPGTVFCSLWANDYGPLLYCVNREDASGRPKFILFDNIDEFKKLNNQSSYLGHSKFISKLQVVSIEDPNDRFKESDVQVVPIPVPLCPKVSDEDALLPENVSCHNQCYIGAVMAFKSYVLKKPPPKGIIEWEKEWKTMLAELMTGKMIGIDVPIVENKTPTTGDSESSTKQDAESPSAQSTENGRKKVPEEKDSLNTKTSQKSSSENKSVIIVSICVIVIFISLLAAIFVSSRYKRNVLA